MTPKKEKVATSDTTLKPLTTVRFSNPVELGSETENAISPQTRNAQGSVSAAMDLENNRVVITITGKKGEKFLTYVPMSNVSSYRP